MSSERGAFEVLCPRCDVTFAVGTRRCIHCGGKTAGAGSQSVRPLNVDFSFGNSESVAEESFDAPSAPVPQLFQRSEESANFDPEEEPTRSPLRSILASMGSLTWIALLIAFSIFGRACGE
jgi:hypothetical protein